MNELFKAIAELRVQVLSRIATRSGLRAQEDDIRRLISSGLADKQVVTKLRDFGGLYSSGHKNAPPLSGDWGARFSRVVTSPFVLLRRLLRLP